MKTLKIYYIKNVDREYNEDRTELMNREEFERYWSLTSPGYDEGSQPKPRRAEYRLLFDGQIEDQATVETVYQMAQNAFEPNQFAKDRSMMVGDLVELDGELYICHPIGFEKTEWEK